MIDKNHSLAIIITILERKATLVKIKEFTYKSASLITAAICDLLNTLSLFVRTIILDNGNEFAVIISK